MKKEFCQQLKDILGKDLRGYELYEEPEKALTLDILGYQGCVSLYGRNDILDLISDLILIMKYEFKE